MKVLLASLGSPVWWKIYRNSPLILDTHLGEYSLINPLLINSVQDGISQYSRNRFMLPSENEIVFSDSKIGLIRSDERDEGFDVSELFRLIPDFLTWARFLSFQTEIPSIPRVYSVTRFTHIPEVLPIIEPYSSGLEGNARSYIFDSAITSKTAKESAYRVNKKDSVPVFYQFLLDGYANYSIGDYRQCILNSAIAVESYLGAKMDQEYSRRLSGDIGPELRIVDIPQSSGMSIKKDPIYESLASKTDFSALMHERPLYLLGKSLMIEEPETYRLARLLYATRNRIAHRGELSEQDITKCFSMTPDDAWKALKCIKNIFEWFGDEVAYPSNDMVPYVHIEKEI